VVTSEVRLKAFTRPFRRVAIFACVAVASACGGGDGTSPIQIDDNSPSNDPFCSIPETEIFSGGVGRDGIPSLENPLFVPPDHLEASYLQDTDRVIGFEIGDDFLAVPHRILWWHEIVNLDDYGVPVAVSYCPLTGSSMVFDRTPLQGAALGVSGLIHKNNLIMFNRRSDGGQESLFPQMMREARCGPLDGSPLPMYPSVEMRWGAWKELHPGTGVVTGVQPYLRDYQTYPYNNYEDLNSTETLYPHEEFDTRRLPKERVLGIPLDQGSGMAYPFVVLESRGSKVVVHDDVMGTQSVVVFWSTEAQSAAAFVPEAEGQPLTFEVRGDGFFDVETESEWAMGGRAISGPLAGSVLEPVTEAYVSFWFAWATFHPSTEVLPGPRPGSLPKPPGETATL